MDAVAEKKPREMRAQPLDIVNVPGAQLNIRTVEALVGMSKGSILKRIREGNFPAPIRHTCRLSRWTSDSIRQWLADHAVTQ